MDTGTIGFFDTKLVHKKLGVSRDRMIVNRIEKTKLEAHPAFKQERDAKELRERKKEFKEQRIREKQEEEENRKKKEAMSYEWVFGMSNEG